MRAPSSEPVSVSQSRSKNFVSKNKSPNEIKRTAEKAVKSRSEEHTSELQSLRHLVCRLLLEKKKNNNRQSEDRTHKTHRQEQGRCTTATVSCSDRALKKRREVPDRYTQIHRCNRRH